MNKNNTMNYEININDKNYHVIITKKKIKRMIIKINYRSEIMVSTPISISYSDALHKVFLNTKWIEKTLAKHHIISSKFAVDAFLNKNVIYLEGKKYDYLVDENIDSQFTKTTTAYFYKKNPSKTLDAIYNSYYYLLKNEFDAIYSIFDPVIKQKPTLIIQKMKSRWGSCNYHTGKIVINKMLVAVPKELLRYVIVHEFSHLIFPNHSKDFYQTIEEILPNYKLIEKQLKEYSFLLTY